MRWPDFHNEVYHEMIYMSRYRYPLWSRERRGRHRNQRVRQGEKGGCLCLTGRNGGG